MSGQPLNPYVGHFLFEGSAEHMSLRRELYVNNLKALIAGL